MKKIILILITVLLCGLISAEVIFTINSTSRTLSKINTETGSCDNTFCALGQSPNLMDIVGNYGYVVNSVSNNIQKINLDNGETVSEIYIGNSTNPWYAKHKDNFLYVTGLWSNKLYKIDLTTEEIIAEVEVGVCPEDIKFYNEKIYVSCVGNYNSNYEESQITVLSEINYSVIDTINTEINPQNIIINNDKLYIICSGNWSDTHGKLQVYNLLTSEMENTFDIGGQPGRACLANNLLYISDAQNEGIYKYNPQTNEIINDNNNPILFDDHGASVITAKDNRVAFVFSNWGYNQNGVVYYLDENFENPITYQIGHYPTDIIFAPSQTPNSDEDVIEATDLAISYPNPFNNSITFEINKSLKNNHISIYNIKGQLVNNFSSNNNKFQWNGKNFNKKNVAQGIYFYKIKTKDKIISGKIIKIK